MNYVMSAESCGWRELVNLWYNSAVTRFGVFICQHIPAVLRTSVPCDKATGKRKAAGLCFRSGER